MGILTDFLRASDTALVVKAMDEEYRQNLFEQGLLEDDEEGEGLRAVDKTDATGMHELGVFPELIAAIKGVPVADDLVKSDVVWPYGPQPDLDEPTDGEGPESPWTSGPWVTQFDVDVRDALASVRDEDVAAVAARWGDTDVMREFGATADVLRDIVARLASFAKEAEAEGEQLYCWVCL
ncbi:hypothetical protein [Yinghuangia sp. YIM S09857]|uniref:hypothetical protein n=1 Tax=Yinghuangia sp. YIM S09857 TaxID=3436929 RepID=UPI003F52E621